MRRNKKVFTHRPFRHLEQIIERSSLPVFTEPPPFTAVRDQPSRPSNPENDRHLFRSAMKDVEPICRNAHEPILAGHTVPDNRSDPHADGEALRQLEKLVRTGEGFVVSLTPEYREGVGHHVHPVVTRSLHGGRYSIQDHIDLHGLTAMEAEQVFNDFMNAAIRAGKRAVLIVHGRGLSSPGRPVLKSKVHGWLSSGPWRKWVMAFTSARACDGGTGATYVLLRQRSITKRHRKPRQRK